MKVLHLIDSGGLYGAEQVVLALAEAQIRTGCDSTIGSIGPFGAGPKSIEIAARHRGIPTTRIETNSGISLLAIAQLIRQVRDLRPDVIHSHGYKANVLLGVVPRRSRPAPVVATLHGWTSGHTFSKNSVFEWLDKKVLPRLDVVVAVSERMRQNTVLARLSSLIVIPNGMHIDRPALSPVEHGSDALRRFCAQAPTLIMMGRLSAEKNQAMAIRALAEVRATHPSLQLLLVGEGALRPELEALVSRLGIKNCVLMPGYVESAWRLLPDATAMLLTSITEGSPVCILEAMREKTPIIATAVGDVPDILQRGLAGWLIAPGDEQALKCSILECIDDSMLRNEKVNAAHERLRSDYSIERMLAGYAQVYTLAVARASR